jgi:SH3-like domain-containing protein
MKIASGNLFTGAMCLILLLLLIPRTVFADPVAVGAEHCVINVRSDDRLNMRSQPNSRAAIVTRLRYASCGITVTGSCTGSWCPAENGHYRGWVHRHFVAAVSPARYCVVGVGVGDRLNLRAFPSPQSRVLTSLARNQCGIAYLPYSVGNWQKVRVAGWEGWAHRRYLSGQ